MGTLLDQVWYNSECMQQVQKAVTPSIQSATPLLFWGEPGSGMGFYIKAIHEASARPGDLLRIPGASVDEKKVEEQFYGVDNRRGWLEEADKGTIFLKRISDMPPTVQKTLARIIGNQSVDGRIQFARRGRVELQEVNVRFMCSMTQNPDTALQEGEIEQALFDELRRHAARIVQIPPLRERQEDIVNIASNFFAPFNAKYGQTIGAIDDAAQTLIKNYPWPGNIDELKRVFEGIFAGLSGETIIRAAHFPEELKSAAKTDGTKSEQYHFELEGGAKFVGAILSPSVKIQTGSKKISITTADLKEIKKLDRSKYLKSRYLTSFIFHFKNGDQITGEFLDKRMDVWASFDPNYQIETKDIYSIYLLK